jgi:S-adenosylmethionine synthetase
MNTLDDPARGTGGMYLTVLGTSAEGADGGQVGRGNRVNGLISLHRPMSTEAAAGKNPVSHVGKIYNQLAHQMAATVHASVEGIEEVSIWLCSQIGRPLADPWSLAVELVPAQDASLAELERHVRDVVEARLLDLPALVERLIRGELPVC